MLSTTINGVSITCKPENLIKYQTKLAKPSKGGTSKSAEKRVFPKSADSLRSTDAYVREYLRLNSIGYCDVAVAHEHWILNTAPTTWPEGPDCIVTEEE
jgi:hypothetical protein